MADEQKPPRGLLTGLTRDEMDDRLASGTPPPTAYVRKNTTGRFETARLVVDCVAAAIGADALPEKQAKKIRDLVANMEQACEVRVQTVEDARARLETTVNEQRAEIAELRANVEKIRVKAAQVDFDHGLEVERLENKIGSLTRLLEAAQSIVRRSRPP